MFLGLSITSAFADDFNSFPDEDLAFEDQTAVEFPGDDELELEADFDDLPDNMSKNQKRRHDPTAFEGTIAHYDSGSGWFVNDGEWKSVCPDRYPVTHW